MFTQLTQVSSHARRRLRLVASLATAAGLLVIGWHLLVVLIPLIVSAIAAALLMPVMRLGERSPLARRWPQANRLIIATAASLLAVIAVLAVLGLATYALIGGALKDALRQLIPGPMREDLAEIGRLAGRTIVAYIRVQLFGAIFVGGLIWLLYWSVGIELALPLGMLAAFTELVPIIGSTVFILIAGIAVALTDLQKLPLAVAFFVLVQVVYGSIVFPRLQGQALGLHPVILVVTLAVFSVFFGILGALVAAPITGATYRVLQYAREEWNNAETPA